MKEFEFIDLLMWFALAYFAGYIIGVLIGWVKYK
jgi:hypothetical protein